jgi:DNA-binding MarR family transcriptional regulator
MRGNVVMRSLEEQVLRIFYEGACSADECARELSLREHDVKPLLAELAARTYLAVQMRGSVLRYSLTPNGSERLATLVE